MLKEVISSLEMHQLLYPLLFFPSAFSLTQTNKQMTIALILLYRISLSSFHLFHLIEEIAEVYLNDIYIYIYIYIYIVIACYGRRTATSKIRVQFWKTTVLSVSQISSIMSSTHLLVIGIPLIIDSLFELFQM